MVSEIVTHEGEAIIHPPQQLYAGDDWEIRALCLNTDGTPMDLIGADIEWIMNEIGLLTETRILTLTSNDGIVAPAPTSGDNPTGIAIIDVPALLTMDIPPGYYRDQLTVINRDLIQSTIWQGRIQVLARLS
jgi:hypothetical protein